MPLLAAVRRVLPRGRTLPYDAWRRRHRLLVGLLLVHAVAVLVYAAAAGWGWLHGLVDSVPAAVLALIALKTPGRRVPATIVSIGLLTCAAMVIHLSGGVTDAHFDFFVVLIFLTLYEDWVPFLVSVVFVLVHHALFTGLQWTAAATHAGFMVAAAAGLLTVWRFNEDVRHRLRALVDGSGDAIVEIDARGEVVGWNAAAQALLGYAAADIECQPVAVLAAPGRAAELEGMVESALQGEPFQRREIDWAREDGGVVEVELTVSPIIDAGRPVGASVIVHDMGERLALQEVEQRFRDLVERVPAITYVAEPGELGRWRYVSPQIEEMLGYTPEEWLADARLWAERIHPEDRERVVAEEERFASTREPLASEYRMVAKDGSLVWVRDDAVFRTRRPGRADVMDGILTNITALKVMEERLRHMANHDHMTGLFNRHRFEDELGRAVAYTQRYGPPSALLVLDLDGVKKVNDEFGHHAGDELLKRVASGMQHRLRAVDSVGRLGGDEFGVLLPGVDRAGAEAAAHSLVELIGGSRLELDGRAVGTTASVGIALLRQGEDLDSERLLMQADSAMYEAKHAGGDRVAVFEPTGGPEPAPAAG